MNKDDTVYVTMLVLSIPIGCLFKHLGAIYAHLFAKNDQIDSSNTIRRIIRLKAILSCLVGIVIVFTVCRYDILHSLFLIVTNSLLLIIVHPKYSPYLSFLWCFGYLLFFRLCHLLDVPKPAPYTNAVQLMLTLKLVGLSFEMHDSYKRKLTMKKLLHTMSSQETSGQQHEHTTHQIDALKLEMDFLSVDSISFWHMFAYSYCYVGILTGPYFKFRTYKDWLNSSYGQNVDSLAHIVRRGQWLPIFILGFLLLSKYVSFKDAAQDEFYDNPLWYRLLYMSLAFTMFRFRFYIAWIFAEISCITAGFGVYPVASKPQPGAGPTILAQLKQFNDKKADPDAFNFKTVHNIDEYECETNTTVKGVLHKWNMTVQYWMAKNVYKRVSFRPAGQPLTMALSAYWHGLHGGYYLGMLSTTPCIIAEDLMEKGFKKRFLSVRFYGIYNFCAWFFRTRQFDYMSMGFILLETKLTLRYWTSIYFCGHVACFVFIVIGFCLIKLAPKKRETSDEKQAKKE